MPRIPKTILNIEVNDKTYHVLYSGSFKYSNDKTARKHDQRLMEMLMASDEMLEFFYSLVMPVVRYKRREARKAAKKQSNNDPSC